MFLRLLSTFCSPFPRNKLVKTPYALFFGIVMVGCVCVAYISRKWWKRKTNFCSIIMYCCYSSNHLDPIFGVESQPTCFAKVFCRFFVRFLWPFSRLKSNLGKYYNLGGSANKFNLWCLYVVTNSCLFFLLAPLPPHHHQCVLTISPTEYKTA